MEPYRVSSRFGISLVLIWLEFSCHSGRRSSISVSSCPVSESIATMFEFHMHPVALIYVRVSDGLARNRLVESTFVNVMSSSRKSSSSLQVRFCKSSLVLVGVTWW